MSRARRTAVSYTRFSNPSQAKGDSESRQEREYKAFCERHDLAAGKEVFIDRGRSGYHGTHRTKGALGVLVQAAKDGRFDPGSVVVVESWDRLGRLRPDKQIELVAELLRTGVSIGVCRLNDIFTEEDFGSHRWTALSVFVALAYQESRQKSDRLKSVWAKRRQRAVETGEKLRGSLPAWVERAGGGLRLIPERAAAVKRIYQLAIEGNGVTRIIRALEAEGVKPFGVRKVSEHRTRSAFSGRWTKAYIGLLLRDRRTVGEHQLYKGKHKEGAAIANYFPTVIAEETFNLARAAQAGKGRKGPRQRKYANAFRGLLVESRGGSPFNMANVYTRKDVKLYLKNTETTGRCVTIPYDMFERCILGRLREVRAEDVFPADRREASSADAIRADLAAARGELAEMQKELARGFSKTLMATIRATEAREVELVNALSDELARTAKPLAKAWDDAAGLLAALDGAEDKDAMRIKIRAALAAVVESGFVLAAGTKGDRVIVVQFDFVGGARRTWAIRYLPANGARPNPPAPECKSLADVGLPDADLRDPKAAARLEALIAKHLAALTGKPGKKK